MIKIIYLEYLSQKSWTYIFFIIQQGYLHYISKSFPLLHSSILSDFNISFQDYVFKIQPVRSNIAINICTNKYFIIIIIISMHNAVLSDIVGQFLLTYILMQCIIGCLQNILESNHNPLPQIQQHKFKHFTFEKVAK